MERPKMDYSKRRKNVGPPKSIFEKMRLTPMIIGGIVVAYIGAAAFPGYYGVDEPTGLGKKGIYENGQAAIVFEGDLEDRMRIKRRINHIIASMEDHEQRDMTVKDIVDIGHRLDKNGDGVITSNELYSSKGCELRYSKE